MPCKGFPVFAGLKMVKDSQFVDQAELFGYMMKPVKNVINSRQKVPIRDKKLILLEAWNFLRIQQKLLLLKVIILFSFIKLVWSGKKRSQFVINFQQQVL